MIRFSLSNSLRPLKHLTSAYFRSRAASSGEGISAAPAPATGFEFHSTGKVTVKCLNPVHTVASIG